MSKPADRISRILADEVLIDRAMTRATQVALKKHQQAGNPLPAWRDGKIIWLAAEDIGKLLREETKPGV